MGSDSDFSFSDNITLSQLAGKADNEIRKIIKKHKCDYPGCTKAFNRPWKLQRHSYSHTKERPFKCSYEGCTKDYRSKAHLFRHVSLSHSEKRNSRCFIECPYPDCPQVCSNLYSLKKHQKTHTNFVCNDCGIKFRKKRQLNSHMYVHTGIATYSCKVCNEKFITHKQLILHEKRHNPKSCLYENCETKCDNWSDLRRHMKIMHPQIYTCDNCGKTFHNKNTLTCHVYTHLPQDDKLVFACTVGDCRRFYFHKKNLTHHLRTCHERKRYHCGIDNCTRSFTAKHRLLKHQQSIHCSKDSTTVEPKKKKKETRAVRKDKGLPKRSMAGKLSGLLLPPSLEKAIVQNLVTNDVEVDIQEITRRLIEIEENNRAASVVVNQSDY